ncbi:segregation and condensation protein A [Striga asiatica]|uniref:Segregation and condensation protein A n=1 Tax=Striga asiatica TaxID=4170 RepID=A0A5A7P0V8_STRAF|nr:segregation and condensation protein A [Striga asiatica]
MEARVGDSSDTKRDIDRSSNINITDLDLPNKNVVVSTNQKLDMCGGGGAEKIEHDFYIVFLRDQTTNERPTLVETHLNILSSLKGRLMVWIKLPRFSETNTGSYTRQDHGISSD